MAEQSNLNFLPSAVVEKLEEAGIPKDSVIFYQNERWVYQKGRVPFRSASSYCEKIRSLGPFDVHEVDVSLDLLPDSPEYRITRIGTHHFPNEAQMTSVIAPITPITLEESARTTANIPVNATHFCWLYPLYGMLENSNLNLSSQCEINLLRIGGFAYFKIDKANPEVRELLRVNAIMLSNMSGIDFDGPYTWPHEFTESLWKQKRFQRVTLQELLDYGAKYFAFINPYEPVVNDKKVAWSPSKHGAFVYLFNEDHSPHRFDCFFSVTDDCLGIAPESDQEL